MTHYKGKYYMCVQCEYNGSCSLQSLAPDLTGCSGHSIYSKALLEKERSKYKEREKQLEDSRVKVEEKNKRNEELLKDLKPGDKVIVRGVKYKVGCGHLPLYIEGCSMTVLRFTRSGNIICDYDGGKPFSIPRWALEVVEKDGEKVGED